jgi:excinuclease ABC subunit C
MISLENIKKLPDTPGVYFFTDDAGNVLYIGKATSLRDRVRSYLSADLPETRGPLLVKMMIEATNINFENTDSVLEALILEANLIKKHKPPYNTAEKDDKSFNYVVITKEDFPKVLTVRGRELEMEKINEEGKKYQAIFGPFIQGGSLREALKIIRRIFPYRDNKCTPLSGRPCFNRQIGLCPGVCTGEISKDEYKEIIKNIKLFFEGKKKAIVKSLEKEMAAHAKNRDFEKASQIKKTVFALEHIQDIALIKNYRPQNVSGLKTVRIESYDIAHMSGKNVVGVMTVVEDGEARRGEYRKFKIKQNPGVNDTAALKEILSRRLNHEEWPMPQIIVVDGGKAQINAAEAVLKERNLTIDVVSVVKDERHKPREILGKQSLVTKYESDILIANSESHRFAITYHRKLRSVF